MTDVSEPDPAEVEALRAKVEAVRVEVRELMSGGVKPRDLLNFFDGMRERRNTLSKFEYLAVDLGARLELMKLGLS